MCNRGKYGIFAAIDLEAYQPHVKGRTLSVSRFYQGTVTIQRDLQPFSNGSGKLLLDLKDVLHLAVVAFGPAIVAIHHDLLTIPRR